jgi:hypothetical protein
VSWSKHIDAVVARKGRSLSIIRRYSAFLNNTINKALVLLHWDDCSVMWSGATKRDLGKLQLSQNRAAQLGL